MNDLAIDIDVILRRIEGSRSMGRDDVLVEHDAMLKLIGQARAYNQLWRAARAFVRIFNEFPDDPGAYQERFDDLWTVVNYHEVEADGFTGIRDDLAEIMAS